MPSKKYTYATHPEHDAVYNLIVRLRQGGLRVERVGRDKHAVTIGHCGNGKPVVLTTAELRARYGHLDLV